MVRRPKSPKQRPLQQLELDFPAEAPDTATVIFGLFGLFILVMAYGLAVLFGVVTVYETWRKLASSEPRGALTMLLLGAVMIGCSVILGTWLANGVMLQRKLATAAVVIIGAFIAYPKPHHPGGLLSSSSGAASLETSILMFAYLGALVIVFIMSSGKRAKA